MADNPETPAHPDHIIGLSSPVTILDKDYDFLEACPDILKLRNHRENNPPPRPAPSATKKTKQTVAESTLSSPVNSQTQRSNSRASSHQPNQRSNSRASSHQPNRRAASPTNSSVSNLSTNSDTPWKEKLQILQQQIEDNKINAQAQKEEARLSSNIDKQQLRDHNQRITEQFAIAQQKNIEFGRELNQKQLDLDAARIEAKLSIKKKEDLLLIEHKQREKEL